MPDDSDISKWTFKRHIQTQAKGLKRDVTFNLSYPWAGKIDTETFSAIENYGATLYPTQFFSHMGSNFEIVFEEAEPYGVEFRGEWDIDSIVSNKGLPLPEIELQFGLSRKPNFTIRVNANDVPL